MVTYIYGFLQAKYATDLKSLENRFRGLANTVLDLEIKKKELSTQLIDLTQVINQYQIAIDNKKPMDFYLNTDSKVA